MGRAGLEHGCLGGRYQPTSLETFLCFTGVIYIVCFRCQSPHTQTHTQTHTHIYIKIFPSYPKPPFVYFSTIKSDFSAPPAPNNAPRLRHRHKPHHPLDTRALHPRHLDPLIQQHPYNRPLRLDSPAPERPRARHRTPPMAPQDEMARARSGGARNGGLCGVAAATGGEEIAAGCEGAVGTSGAAFQVSALVG